MVLLLDTDQSAKTGHHGYDFRINQTRSASDKASVERWVGKSWQSIANAVLQVGKNELHLAVERTTLDLTTDKPLRFDFKWTDNIPADTDPIDYLDLGDTAPNARFHYRFTAEARVKR